jgi:hypothetical protein
MAAAGLCKWPVDVLRHSSVSYHLAAHETAAKVALEMGHASPKMIFAHYRAIVRPDTAHAWWELMPEPTKTGKKHARDRELKADGKIIRFQKGSAAKHREHHDSHQQRDHPQSARQFHPRHRAQAPGPLEGDRRAVKVRVGFLFPFSICDLTVHPARRIMWLTSANGPALAEAEPSRFSILPQK